MTPQDLINFETDIKELWESGELPCLLHLSGGNELHLLEIFGEVNPKEGDWVFSTHRNHYHALLAGIPASEVKGKILDGRSMFVYSKAQNFVCSAVLAGTCGIAAGVAWAVKKEWENGRDGETEKRRSNDAPIRPFTDSPIHVFCFIGDGGEEQGHFYEAAMFVEGHGLPCTFIIEDNNRSVDTPRTVRRPALEAGPRGLEGLFKCVRRYEYAPTYPHAGSGCEFQIEFKPDAIERMRPVVPPTGGMSAASTFLGSLAEHPQPDAFHRATALPYGGDCGRKTSDLLKRP